MLGFTNLQEMDDCASGASRERLKVDYFSITIKRNVIGEGRVALPL